MFTGAAIIAPLLVLAVYDYGQGRQPKSPLIQLLMSTSYLRYGLKAILDAIYGADRPSLPCPEDEIYCFYANPKVLLADMGMLDIHFTQDILILFTFYVFIKSLAYFLLQQRLSPSKIAHKTHLLVDVFKSYFRTTVIN